MPSAKRGTQARATIERCRGGAGECVTGARGVDHSGRRCRDRDALVVAYGQRTSRPERDDDRAAVSRRCSCSEIFGHGRQPVLSADAGRFVFVDDQHIDPLQQIVRHRGGGRGIEHDPDAAAASASREHGDLRHGHLQLQHQRGAGPKGGVGNLRCARIAIGACDDGYRVLAMRIHVDQGDAGGRVDCSHARQVDPRRFQVRERRCGKRIAPDGTEQGHMCSGARRSQRLVGTLAAGQRRERPAGQRLAGRGNARNLRHQVQVDGTEDDDHQSLAMTPLTSRMLPKRRDSPVRTMA